MDKTILNILFDWRGSITSREFRAGLSVLFLSLSAALILYIGQLLFTVTSGYMGSEYLIRFNHLRDILYTFIPNLIPVYFILSYSSFVLVVKRMRKFTSNIFFIVLAGIAGFAFFASFFSLQKIGMYALDTESSGYGRDILKPLISTLNPIILGLMLIGLIVIIILMTLRKEGPKEFVKRFDVIKYALCLGNLMAISIGISTLLILACIIFGEIFLLYLAYNHWVLYVFIGIPHLVLFIFFIIGVIARLKDAGRSFWWAIGSIGGFFAITVLAICGIKWYWNITTIYFVYQICLNIYIAGVYILFLLPTKQIKEIAE